MSLIIENFKVEWLGTKPPINGQPTGGKLHVSFDARVTNPILLLRNAVHLDDEWRNYEYPEPQYTETGVYREDYIEERFLTPPFNILGHTYGRSYTYRDTELNQIREAEGAANFSTTMEIAVPVVGVVILGAVAYTAYTLTTKKR